MSDPGRAFADLCAVVMKNSNETGDQVLARAMGVETSSTQLLVNVGAIHQRAEGLMALCDQVLPSEDVLSVKQSIMLLQQSFLPMSLRRPWCERPSLKQEESAMMALRVLSAYIRTEHPRPQLSPNALQAVQRLPSVFMERLEALNLGDHAHFQRTLHLTAQALDNRLGFVFWLGWENTLRPLNELVGELFAIRYAATRPGVEPALQDAYALGEGLVIEIANAVGIVHGGAGPDALLDIGRTLSGIVHYDPVPSRLCAADVRVKVAEAA